MTIAQINAQCNTPEYKAKRAARIAEVERTHFKLTELEQLVKRYKAFVPSDTPTETGFYSLVYFHTYAKADKAIAELRSEGYKVSDRARNYANGYFKYMIFVTKN